MDIGPVRSESINTHNRAAAGKSRITSDEVNALQVFDTAPQQSFGRH